MSDEWCCRLCAIASLAGATFWPSLGEVKTACGYLMAVVLVCAAMVLKAVRKTNSG